MLETFSALRNHRSFSTPKPMKEPNMVSVYATRLLNERKKQQHLASS
jgi:hypothetical protein